MTLDELLAIAEIVEKLTNRYRDQEAAHKAALTEIRASFNARTSADGKRHEGILDTYRSELDEIDAVINPAREESTVEVAKRLVIERDGLQAEVAALQERLRASIARGDFAQMEVAALKSQTPKQSHPVAVGGYLRRLTGFNTTPAGEIARVTLVDDGDPSQLEYEVVRPNGQKGRWSAKGCEPCDQPATHDTEAGKAAAESAVRTEPFCDVRKVTT